MHALRLGLAICLASATVQVTTAVASALAQDADASARVSRLGDALLVGKDTDFEAALEDLIRRDRERFEKLIAGPPGLRKGGGEPATPGEAGKQTGDVIENGIKIQGQSFGGQMTRISLPDWRQPKNAFEDLIAESFAQRDYAAAERYAKQFYDLPSKKRDNAPNFIALRYLATSAGRLNEAEQVYKDILNAANSAGMAEALALVSSMLSLISLAYVQIKAVISTLPAYTVER